MSDNLRLTIGVDATVAGRSAVDGMAQSIDHLGTEAQQTGTQARTAAAGIEAVAPAAQQAGVAAGTAAANIGAIGPAAQRASAQAVPAQAEIRNSIKSISSELKWLAGAYASIQGGGALIHAAAEMGKVADAAKGMQARMALVVGEGPKLEAAMRGVQDIALSTGASLEDTAKLFTKIADAGKELKIGNQEALALTETISKTVALSGEGAEASKAAMQQLIQALQSGVLRGDEFNSVMEQAPRLSKAMADGLGKTTGELRKMAEAGALSAETVIKALQGQAQTVDKEFSKLPATIGRAITDLSTQWALFIADADNASGASSKAAAVIETLGKNLDLIAAALINSGQAWLGWKAYNIVAEFLGLRTAVAATATATGVATAATIANTAATAANTTAQVANSAARAGAAAGVLDLAAVAGKLGGTLSLLKGFSLAFLVTNLKDVGDWIAKTAYGMTDLAKRNAEVERSAKGVAEAEKKMAAAAAEDAAKKRLAADAAFGLSARSKELVTDFEDQIKKGDKATEAIAKLAKALDLSTPKGINVAGAALDDLARKGALSADQVREAWRQALSGKDLRIFEVEANAAFDNTDQGQRRLAASMDAVLGEAIKRTGKDLPELATGISAAAQSAINDFDVLIGRTDELKVKGLDVGEVLATSLDQAAKAATTEAAMKAVVARWEDLGKSGQLAGERLRKGLDGAKEKLDELKPGINSVAEAFKNLGLKSGEELKRTADAARQSFETIRQSGMATPAQIAEAFRRYAAIVLEANGGVASETLKTQAAMQGLTIDVDAAGKAIITTFDQRHPKDFGDAVKGAADEVIRLKDAQDRQSGRDGVVGTWSGSSDGGGRGGKGGTFTGNFELWKNPDEKSPDELRALGFTGSQISDYYSNRHTSNMDKANGVVTRAVTTDSINHEDVARSMGLTGAQVKAFVGQYGDLLNEEMAALKVKLRNVAAIGTREYIVEYGGAVDRAKARAKDAALATADQEARAAAPASVHRVEITMGGKTTAIDTSSPDSAKGLIELLTGLQRRAANG